MPARFAIAPVLLAGLAAVLPHRAAAQLGCLGIEARLPTPDSIVVTPSPERCGSLRLVLAGRPVRVSPSRFATARGEQEWAIPVALVNAGTTPLHPPIFLDRHRLFAIQRGRRLTDRASRDLAWAVTRETPNSPSYWVFDPPAGAAVLGPGQRSVRTVRVVTHALAQGFQLLLTGGGGALWNREGESPGPPPAPTPRGTSALPPDVARFVAAARLPGNIESVALVHDEARALTVFVVLVTEQGCERSCAQYSAIGVRHGVRSGWLSHNLQYGFPTVAPRLDSARFTLSPRDDAEMFTVDFVARLRAGTARWPFVRARGLDYLVLVSLLRTPGVPREFLLGMVQELYAEGNESLARDMASIREWRDPLVLAQLAVAPGGGEYFLSVRNVGSSHLRGMAPQVAADPTLTAPTLFATALALDGRGDPGVAMRLADHPAARANPAILSVLQGHALQLAPRVLQAVRAPEAQKARLATVLDVGGAAPDARRRAAEALAADPAATEDVLLVLANRVDDAVREAAWRASRRLPEHTLRRWENPVTPRR